MTTKIPQDVIDDLELVRAVLQGFQDCAPKKDGLAAYARLKMRIEALRDQRQAVPDGWKLVRIHPHLETLTFGNKAVSKALADGELPTAFAVWSAMVENAVPYQKPFNPLERAPTPPSSNEDNQFYDYEVVEGDLVLTPATPPTVDAKPDGEAVGNKEYDKDGLISMASTHPRQAIQIAYEEGFLRGKVEGVKKGKLFTHPSNDAMRKALEGLLPWVVTQVVACGGMKCREPVCESCFPNPEEAVNKAIDAVKIARQVLANGEGK